MSQPVSDLILPYGPTLIWPLACALQPTAWQTWCRGTAAFLRRLEIIDRTDRVLSDRDFMFRSGRAAEIH